MLIAALIGFAFGFFGSVPVAGPISALVVSRGVHNRYRSGAFIALGGGIAEAVYAFLAFWGFSTYLARYPLVVPISHALAGVILTALGISFLRYRLQERSARDTETEAAWPSFLLGFTITALNPTLIATWTAVVTTLFSMEVIVMTSSQSIPFAFGACAGIAGWFWLLLWLIRRNKSRLSRRGLERVVRAIGALLIWLAAYFIGRFSQHLMTTYG